MTAGHVDVQGGYGYEGRGPVRRPWAGRSVMEGADDSVAAAAVVPVDAAEAAAAFFPTLRFLAGSCRGAVPAPEFCNQISPQSLSMRHSCQQVFLATSVNQAQRTHG